MTARPHDLRDARRSDFIAAAGWQGARIEALPGDASFRRYFRILGAGRRAMLMDAPPPQEDVRPFIRVARLLDKLGLSAPLIFASDVEAGFLLLEDLGDASYSRLIAAGEDERALYDLAIDVLIELRRRFTADLAEGIPAYSDEKLLQEANLLPQWFLPAARGERTPRALCQDYESLWRELLPLRHRAPHSLVLRDYHVDNLMLIPARPGIRACGLLDFQDAVIGPVTYDLVSLLEDARRDVSAALRDRGIARYLTAHPDIDPEGFLDSAHVLAAQRHAKVIGIFCRLYERDGKPLYLQHLPRLWRLFEQAVKHPLLKPLEIWMNQHVPPEMRGVPRYFPAKGSRK